LLQGRSLACVRGERSLFHGLDLDLGAGECLHVTGPNGAGKTSLLRILAGLLAPTEGSVLWRGADIRRSREEYGTELAFVGHLNGIKDELTPVENLQLLAGVRGQPASQAQAALAAYGLESCAQLPVRHLSQGQRRRVALARLAAMPAALWILDEPFNALDVGSVRTLHDAMAAHRDRGGMAILTAHQDIELPAGTRCLQMTGEGA
jgi:heme exporter protein A